MSKTNKDTIITQLSKFKQELLTRFQGTDEGEVKEYLGCEVIRDRAADPDTRKSMTGYLFSLNGGAVSRRSCRQGGVTLSSAEAENLWQRHKRVKKPSIYERHSGVSISDKSAPLKYGRIMPLVS